MYKDNKISTYQLFCILTAYMVGISLLLNPVMKAKSDAWLASLIGLLGGIVLLILYFFIYRLNSSMTLIGLLKNCFGKFLGTVLGILYIWYFIHLASMVLRSFGEYSLIVNYPETPILFVIGCFALAISLAVRSGIETLGRVSEIFLIVVIFISVLTTITLINTFDLENFKPFLSKGLKPVLTASFGLISLTLGENIVILMIFPNVNKQNKIFRSSILAVLCFGALLLSITARNIMILGADMASRDFFSSATVLKLFPGIESAPSLDINFILVGIIKVSILIYAAATGLAEIFCLKDYKPFVFPLTILTVSLSIWVFNSFLELMHWSTNIWPIYSSIFQILLPIIILMFSLIKYWIRRKHKFQMLHHS